MISVDSSNGPHRSDLRSERRKGPLLTTLVALVVASLAIPTSQDRLSEGESIPAIPAGAGSSAQVPAPTLLSTTGNLGVVAMQFGGTELEASFDECDLRPLRTDETFRAGGLQLPAADQLGVEWTIRVIINHYGPGTFHFEAIDPDGNPGYLAAFPNHANSSRLVARIDETSAVFQTVFFARSAVEPEMPVTIAIDCVQPN